MDFHLASAEVLVPNGLPVEQALARTTHLAIAAHQDDLEIMAFDAIEHCFRREERWFCGVVATDGRGSPRDGLYRHITDDEMWAVRRAEQKKAAVVGEYGALVLLDYPSAAVKDACNRAPVEDLGGLLRLMRPEVVYTHNLADRHDTHVAVALKAIEALRLLPADERPPRLLGCEVWGGLDWLADEDKVTLDVSARESLQTALLGVFDSQISGGKRYDLATLGRRRANATYFASHGVDVTTGLAFAMDLTPLIADAYSNAGEYVQQRVHRFARAIAARIETMTCPGPG
jgi:LmbE family N-acetylglucosaminyl deacetylase